MFQIPNKQSCPATLHNSTQSSFEQSLKKFSMTDLTLKMSTTDRQASSSSSIKMDHLISSSSININQQLSSSNKIDIDQVMVDIKLTPLKSNQFSNRIKLIYQSLNYIKNLSPCLIQEVRTAELIIENIQMKYNRQCVQMRREEEGLGLGLGFVVQQQQKKELFGSHHNHLQQQLQQRQRFQQLQHQRRQNQFMMSSIKQQQQPSLISTKKSMKPSTCNTDTSPIKHLDEPTSRIFYTNFTIKQIQNSCRKQSTQKKPTTQHHSQSMTKNNILINNNQSISKNSSLNGTISNKKLPLANQSNSNKNYQQSVSKCKSVHKKTDSGFTVSNFDAEDQLQMDRLTKNIQALDKVLQQKGLCIKNQSRVNNGKSNTGLKDTSLNSYKQSMLRSQKKPLVFNSKHRLIFSNKQNNY